MLLETTWIEEFMKRTFMFSFYFCRKIHVSGLLISHSDKLMKFFLLTIQPFLIKFHCDILNDFKIKEVTLFLVYKIGEIFLKWNSLKFVKRLAMVNNHQLHPEYKRLLPELYYQLYVLVSNVNYLLNLWQS